MNYLKKLWNELVIRYRAWQYKRALRDIEKSFYGFVQNVGKETAQLINSTYGLGLATSKTTFAINKFKRAYHASTVRERKIRKKHR